MNKDLLNPISMSILLMFLALISIIIFNVWLTTYQSSSIRNIEHESNIRINNIKIETIIGNILYIKSIFNESIEINKITVGKNHCKTNNSIEFGLSEFNIDSCLKNITNGKKIITIETNYGTLIKTIFLT